MQITGYVDSGLIERVRTPASGTFRSDTALFETQDVELIDISKADTKNILYQELSSVYSGVIPSDNVKGQGVRSKIPLYTLKFAVKDMPDNPNFTKKGIVNLKVQPVSLFGRIIKKLASLFLRETGI